MYVDKLLLYELILKVKSQNEIRQNNLPLVWAHLPYKISEQSHFTRKMKNTVKPIEEVVTN